MKTAKVNKMLCEELHKLGAVSKGFTGYILQTKYGELEITLSIPCSRSKTISCYSRFKDVEKAKKNVNCNPYSGKWNWCVWSKDYSAEAFVELVISQIKSVLPGNLNFSPKEWLKKLFKDENCAECHRGARSHTAIPFNGNWFAICNPVKHLSKHEAN